MTDDRSKTEWLQDELSDHVSDIKKMFLNKVRVAVVVRNLEKEEAWVMLGDADYSDVEFVLNKAKAGLGEEIPGKTADK